MLLLHVGSGLFLARLSDVSLIISKLLLRGLQDLVTFDKVARPNAELGRNFSDSIIALQAHKRETWRQLECVTNI